VPTLRRLTGQIAAELELGKKAQPVKGAAAVDRDRFAAVVDDGAVVVAGLESHQCAPQFGAQVVQQIQRFCSVGCVKREDDFEAVADRLGGEVLCGAVAGQIGQRQHVGRGCWQIGIALQQSQIDTHRNVIGKARALRTQLREDRGDLHWGVPELNEKRSAEHCKTCGSWLASDGGGSTGVSFE